MADDTRELTLYVQSKKAVTTFYRPAPSPVPGIGPAPGVEGTAPATGAEYSTRGDESVHFLSDDQARCVAHAEDVAAGRGYHIKVIDIEKSGRVERLIAEHLRGVQTFPVLISPLGFRIEGAESFTDENLAELMPTELKSARAFSYLKVKGGDLDRIRMQLQTMAEVKEVHLLTGDWDLLVVLDFPPSTGSKRRVLDFVTERVRGIPEVVDTSTVVPEYSVTKFPIA
jgi:DNA-binding Lrp family transcriptional regulator